MNMKKEKSNRQVLMLALKNLSDIELVFFRERIVTATKEIIDKKDNLRKEMADGFIQPELIIKCCESIYEQVKFED